MSARVQKLDCERKSRVDLWARSFGRFFFFTLLYSIARAAIHMVCEYYGNFSGYAEGLTRTMRGRVHDLGIKVLDSWEFDLLEYRIARIVFPVCAITCEQSLEKPNVLEESVQCTQVCDLTGKALNGYR